MRKPAQRSIPPTAVRRADGWVLVDTAAPDRILTLVQKRLKLGSAPTETSSGFLVDGGLTRATSHLLQCPAPRAGPRGKGGQRHGEQLKPSAGTQSRSLGWGGRAVRDCGTCRTCSHPAALQVQL